MTISPEEFVKRLSDAFRQDGKEFPKLELIKEKENKYYEKTLEYKGYWALSNAFKSLVLEAIEHINKSQGVQNQISEYYPLFVARIANDFRTLCAAESVGTRGYPLQGYTLLRNTFDNVILTSGALQKLCTFFDIEGIVPGKTYDEKEARKLRKKTEFEVRDQMDGKKSGLSAAALEQLKSLDDLFDLETHGSRLSLTQAMEWMKGKEPLMFVPEFKEIIFALFMNRWYEVAWMVHRLIPLIQNANFAFPDAWKEKWKLVDESFKMMADAMTQQTGKKIGAAIIEFVEAKFQYKDYSLFTLW